MSNPIHLDSLFRDRKTHPNPFNYELSAQQVVTWIASSRSVRAFPQTTVQRPLEFVDSVDLKLLTIPYPRIELFATIVFTIVGTVTPTASTVYLQSITSPPPFNYTLVAGDYVMVRYDSNGMKANTVYRVTNIVGNTIQLIPNGGGAVITLTSEGNMNLPMYLVGLNASGLGAEYAAYQTALVILQFPTLFVDMHCKTYTDIRLINAIDGNHSTARFVVYPDRVQYDERNVPIWIHMKSMYEQVFRFKHNDPLVFQITSRNDEIVTVFTDTGGDATPPLPADVLKQCLANFDIKPFQRDGSFANHMSETTALS